jgi:hypothetical protein
MPTLTYTPLATITLGSSASSVTFSSIPATYRDLILVALPLGDEAGIRFNGDTGSNYTYVQMFGNGTSPFSDSGTLTSLYVTGPSVPAIAQIMDYSATDKHKTALNRRNTASLTFVAAMANRWANTAAVNTMTIIALATTFTAGSRFDLYGIAS